YDTQPQRYRQALQGALQQSMQGIGGAVQRADFQNRMGRFQESAVNSMLREATAKAHNAGRADLAQGVNDGINAALQAPDETSDQAMLKALDVRIHGAQQAGLISRTEELAFRKEATMTYALRRRDMVIANDPVAAAEALRPTGTAPNGSP